MEEISIYQSQNAVQRLDSMLEEHCCWIGLTGPHSLVRFVSEIETRDMAAARASTKQQPSCSSDFELELSVDRVLLMAAAILSTSIMGLMFFLTDFLRITSDGHFV